MIPTYPQGRIVLILKALIVITVFLLTGCGKDAPSPDTADAKGSGNLAAPTPTPTPGACAGDYATGTWTNAAEFGGLGVTLTFREDCTISHSYCQAEWEIVSLPDPSLATSQALTFNVISTQGYAECPSVGQHTCTLEKYSANGHDGIRYDCAPGQAIAVFQ